MRNGIFGSVLLSMIVSSSCVTPPTPVLEDSYDATVEHAVKFLGQSEKRNYLHEIFLESIHAWGKQSSYAQVRGKVKEFRDVRRQFRLEIGNVNAGGYGVIWVIETKSKVVAFSNVFSMRHLTSPKITQAEWRQFLRVIGEKNQVAGCKSDLSVDDGSAYFGTIALGQEVKKFAVYGFVPFPPTPTAQNLYLHLSPCSEIILAAYSLVRSAHTP
ncbi:MAG TPA: hypothetical protein VLB76_08215 [Thermoanaerobaculia bacterium]|jgi:hypothetical protein|nr:hypothetical protein [Thermoanaerobaculia bacterium]